MLYTVEKNKKKHLVYRQSVYLLHRSLTFKEIQNK
jgi:hypothetical protein